MLVETTVKVAVCVCSLTVSFKLGRDGAVDLSQSPLSRTKYRTRQSTMTTKMRKTITPTFQCFLTQVFTLPHQVCSFSVSPMGGWGDCGESTGMFSKEVGGGSGTWPRGQSP
jgi:hypothetical protein